MVQMYAQNFYIMGIFYLVQLSDLGISKKIGRL
jgi:hypothetical protein